MYANICRWVRVWEEAPLHSVGQCRSWCRLISSQYSLTCAWGKKLKYQTWDSCDVFLATKKSSNSDVPWASSRCIALLLASLQKIPMTASNPPVGSALPQEPGLPPSVKMVLARVGSKYMWWLYMVIGGHPLWLWDIGGLKTYTCLADFGWPMVTRKDATRWVNSSYWCDSDVNAESLIAGWFHDFTQTFRYIYSRSQRILLLTLTSICLVTTAYRWDMFRM